MKKPLLTLACTFGVTAACAQSSVTLFGVVDTLVAVGRGKVANRTQLSNSGMASTRLGFRGTEDLGGGLKASFWLEAGFASDSGAGAATNTNNQVSGGAGAQTGAQGLTFNRRSTVSLHGDRWGELRLGRDFTPSFWNLIQFDPFSYAGVGITAMKFASSYAANVPTNFRASNAIQYHTPQWGGFYGQAMVALGENPSGLPVSSHGRYVDVRVGYNSADFAASLSHSVSNLPLQDAKRTQLGLSYDAKVAKVFGFLATDVGGAGGRIEGRFVQAGVHVPVGAGLLRASYGSYRTDVGPGVRQLAAGYVHHLSKRTALYATVAQVRNRGGASFALNGASTSPNGSSTGLDAGIRHIF